MTVFCKNEEQSAVADEAKGYAWVALTARRQLSALHSSLLTNPGEAQAGITSSEGTSNRLERMIGLIRIAEDNLSRSPMEKGETIKTSRRKRLHNTCQKRKRCNTYAS